MVRSLRSLSTKRRKSLFGKARTERRRRLRFEMLEDRRVLTTGTGPQIDEFSAVGVGQLNSGINGITSGQNGTVWFTEQTQTTGGVAQTSKLGKITSDGTITEYDILTDDQHTPINSAYPFGITTDPFGEPWIALGRGGIVRFNPSDGTFKTYSQFTDSKGSQQSIGSVSGITFGFTQLGPNTIAGLYFTDQANDAIGKFDAFTGAITEYPLPKGLQAGNKAPYGITEGPDGNIWFTELNPSKNPAIGSTPAETQSTNKVGRLALDGTITEYVVPSALASPEGITVGPDGCLWFTEQNSNKLGRITPAGKDAVTGAPTITDFSLPGDSSLPTGITLGPDHKLWFTEAAGHQVNETTLYRIGQFDPATGQTNEFTIPTSANSPTGITLGTDGNLWFGEDHVTQVGFPPSFTHSGKIGRVIPAASTDPAIDVKIEDLDTHSPVKQGDQITFHLTVTNTDSQRSANLTVYDPIPEGAQFTPGQNQNVFTSDFGSASVSNGLGTVTIGSLPPLTPAHITLRVTAGGPGQIVNRAYAVGASPDPKFTDNAVATPVTVLPPTTIFSMGGTLTVPGVTGVPKDPLKFDPNTNTSTTGKFNWTLLNAGGDSPQDVVVSMTIPSTLTDVVAYPPTVFNYNDTTRLLTFYWSTLPNTGDAQKDTVNFGFTARPTTVGNITVTATVKDDALVAGIPLVSDPLNPQNPPLPGYAITTHVNTAVTSASLSGSLKGDSAGSPMEFNTSTNTAVTAGIFGWQLANTGDTTIKGASITIPLTGQPLTGIVPEAYFTDILHPVGTAVYTDATPTDPTRKVTITGLPDLPAHGQPLHFGFLAYPTGVGQATAAATVTINGNFTATNSNTISATAYTTIEKPTVTLSVDKDLEIIDGPADSGGESASLSGKVNSMVFNTNTQLPDSHGDFHWTLSNTGNVDATDVVVTISVPQSLKYSNNSGYANKIVKQDGKLVSVPCGDVTYFDQYPFDESILRITIPTVAARDNVYFGFTADPRKIGPVLVKASIAANENLRGGDGKALESTIPTYVFAGGQYGHLYNLLDGPVVPKAHLIPIYYGSQWDDTANQPKQVTDFPAFMQDAMASIVDSPYMDFLSQYKGGGYTIGRGDVGGYILADSGPADSTLNDSVIQQFVHDEVDAFKQVDNGVIPDPVNTIFVIYVPPNILVKNSTGDSVSNFLGYHNVVPYFDGFLNLHPDFYKYIVMPWHDGGPGKNGKVDSNLSVYQSETVVFSHELAETVTDPTTFSGWQDIYKKALGNGQPGGGVEVGDLAANLKLQNENEGAGDYGTLHGKYDDYEVQYLWANEYTYPGTNTTVTDQPVLPTGGAADTSQVKVYANGLLHIVTVVGGGGESSSYSFSGTIGSFDDPKNVTNDSSVYTATIDWGDDTKSDGTISYDANLKQYLISASHNFMAAAGSTATISIFVANKVTGFPVGRFSEVVTLQETSADAAKVQFDQPAIDAYRNGSDAVISVDRVGDTTLGATVDFHVSGGTAVDGTDYQSQSGTLTFGPGATKATILLPIYSNPDAAGDVTVNLMLSTPIGNIVLGNQTTTTVTIHPGDQVFAPPAPVLDSTSDTGASMYDAVTASNGSADLPLTFKVTGASIRNGFLQLVDVTDPDNPVILGDPVQAKDGAAAIKLASDIPLADGMHKIAVINAVSATAGARRASQTTTITIDTAAPTSHINLLPGRTKITDLAVSWGGADNTGGAGVQSYDISVSVDGAAATPWLTDTTDTSASFAATVGHTYAFFATATDLAGNTETAHTNADTAVLVTKSPWQNAHNPLDVDTDGVTATRDVAHLLGYLNAFGAGELPASASNSAEYYDCDGDNEVATKDVVLIILHLNSFGAGEGESQGTGDRGQETVAGRPLPVAGNQLPSDVLTLLAADAALQATRPKK